MVAWHRLRSSLQSDGAQRLALRQDHGAVAIVGEENDGRARYDRAQPLFALAQRCFGAAPRVLRVLWLTLVWILLWGTFSWANLIGGLASELAGLPSPTPSR